MVPAGREVKGISIRRKVFHLGLGTIFILSMLSYHELRWFYLAVLAFGVILSFVQERHPFLLISWFLDRYDKRSDPIPGQGPLTFFFGAVLIWFLFPSYAAVPGVIVLTFGDPMAYLGGRLIDGAKLPWNSEKTWAGILSFIIFPFLLLLLLYGPVTAVSGPVVGAIVESIKWPHRVLLDDNIVVPISSSASVFLFLVL